MKAGDRVSVGGGLGVATWVAENNGDACVAFDAGGSRLCAASDIEPAAPGCVGCTLSRSASPHATATALPTGGLLALGYAKVYGLESTVAALCPSCRALFEGAVQVTRGAS